jgi:hypothetical protein
MILATLRYIPSAKASAQIVLLYSYGFSSGQLGSNSYVFNVVGEVQNIGDSAAYKINITIAFRDSSGNPLGSYSGTTFINCTAPGEKVPFRVAPTKVPVPDRYSVSQYTILSVTWSDYPSSSGKDKELEITNSTYYTKNERTYVVGVAKNNGELNATHTKVTVTYYDKTTGNILWATRSSDESIASGENATFVADSYPMKNIPYQNCNVTLVAESDEYISPHFPTPVRDTINPQIRSVVWLPSSPTPQDIVRVNATVTKPSYTSNVSRVVLHYRPQGGQLKEKNMTRLGGNVWSNTTESFGAGQTVEFYIEAFDDAGHNAQSTLYYYTVQGKASGVPIEYVLVALIVIVSAVVIYRYRKRLFQRMPFLFYLSDFNVWTTLLNS